MNDVRINGVKYVPFSNKPSSHHVKKLSSVLAKECPYLSRTVRDNIVKKFEFDDIKTKPKTKPSSDKGKLLSIKNFKGIDESGHVLFKRGRHSKSEWTIYQASDIRQWLNHGKFKSDYDKTKQLSEKFGLSEPVVRKLVYNLEHGEFSTWLDIMISKNVNAKSEEQPKKEDMGWF